MPKSGEAGGLERAAAVTDASGRPIIPNEIFLKIFSYIRRSVELELTDCRHILSQLSLVCSFFCTALRPRRFRSLVLGEDDDSLSKAFRRALMSGDTHARALALHIRKCRISCWPPGDPSAWTAALSILVYTPNIEFLQLRRLDIGAELWSIIRPLSNLKTFKVWSVSFKDDIPVEAIDHIARMRLSSLGISSSQVFSLPQILNTTALSVLYCDSEHLETLLAGGPISTLESLALSNFISLRSLAKNLAKVPSLRSLSLYSSITEDPEVTTQHFSALLPDLRSLSCWFPLLAFLAPGRPLVSLCVMGNGTPLLDLGTILGSHAPCTTITDIMIPPTIYLTAGHFPNLRKLHMTLPMKAGQVHTPGPEATAELITLITDTCEKWPVHPSVERLHITVEAEFIWLDLPLQYAVLTGNLLSWKFPALRWFQLGEYAEWERFAEDEAWRVLIAAESRVDIAADFDAGKPGVVDHGGYLQQLSAQTQNLP